MFVWWSNGSGNTRIGCCGGLVFLPFALFTMSAGVGDLGIWLLILGVTVAAALFLLPNMMNAPAREAEKRKNDEYMGDEKPKRDVDSERYILTDDGEILEVRDEEPPRSQRTDL